MYTPPGTPRSRSFIRLTMRVDLPHLGQSVLLLVSMTFLRSAVFAILGPTAMIGSPDLFNMCAAIRLVRGRIIVDGTFSETQLEKTGIHPEDRSCVSISSNSIILP